jgi:hypothetical protein
MPCHPQQVIAVRPSLEHQLGVAVEQRGEDVDVVRFDGAVGEDERGGRLTAVA